VEKKVKIFAFGGSLRKDSYTAHILKGLAEFIPNDAVLDTFEPSDLGKLPHFNQDDDMSQPESVKNFKERVKAADAIIIVTPEYNYSVPSLIKNAIEWGSRPYGDNSFDGKTAAIVSSSIGMLGGSRAQYHLRQIMTFLGLQAVQKPEVMIPFIQDKLGQDGKIKDEETKKHIRDIVSALVILTQKLSA
jgi:Predicted flavoprotein